MDCAYRPDFIVEDAVIVELKAVEKVLPIHEAQLITYRKLSGCRVGLLINFNVPVLKDGITRRVQGQNSPRSTQVRQRRQIGETLWGFSLCSPCLCGECFSYGNTLFRKGD